MSKDQSGFGRSDYKHLEGQVFSGWYHFEDPADGHLVRFTEEEGYKIGNYAAEISGKYVEQHNLKHGQPVHVRLAYGNVFYVTDVVAVGAIRVDIFKTAGPVNDIPGSVISKYEGRGLHPKVRQDGQAFDKRAGLSDLSVRFAFPISWTRSSHAVAAVVPADMEEKARSLAGKRIKCSIVEHPKYSMPVVTKLEPIR
jgi:hypothetical protein